MKILVIGGGGREHALCWKLAQSPEVEKIYCVPGNAGISNIAQCREMAYQQDFSSLVQLVKKEGINFTVVGPEAPLVNGIVDYFQKRGLEIFGPSRRAALLGGSKVFAKRFMKEHCIPTADFEIFSLSQDREISFSVLTDGENIKSLVSSRDQRRIYKQGEGLNRRGIGAYSPISIPIPLYKKIMERVIIPTLKGMKEEGREYRGALSASLIVERGEPKVLGFNVHFGDPETQVILPRLRNDLLEVLWAVKERNLNRITLNWRSHAAVCIILVSSGYPGNYQKGKKITGLESLSQLRSIFPFHAAVKKEGDCYLTDGGRVMGITALAKDLKEATRQAYRAVNKVHFEGIYYRKDIGYQALKK